MSRFSMDSFDLFEQTEPPAELSARDRSSAMLNALTKGDVFYIGKVAWVVERSTGAQVYATRHGSKGRKLYWIRPSDLAGNFEAVEINPGTGDVLGDAAFATGELRRKGNPTPAPGEPPRAAMAPALAQVVLEAYARVGGGKLTSTTGKAVLRAWLRGRGWQEDRYGNFLRAEDPTKRQHFKQNVINVQNKLSGGWYNASSTSIVDLATHTVLRAAEASGDEALAARLQGVKAQKKASKEKAVSRAAQDKRERDASIVALKVLAREHPDLIAKNLRGETLSDADYEMLTARKAALLSSPTLPRAEDLADVDHPPVLPVYRDVKFRWVDESTGVPYTIELSHVKGVGARVSIGAHSGLSVDPVTHAMVMRDMGAVGDGILTGRITWDADEKRYVGAVFFIKAGVSRAGAGTRLMRLWCRLMHGYGSSSFLAEAVGEEGEAAMRALEKRGALRLLGRRGAYWAVECAEP